MPAGWLPCEYQTLLWDEYPKLRDAIGTRIEVHLADDVDFLLRIRTLRGVESYLGQPSRWMPRRPIADPATRR